MIQVEKEDRMAALNVDGTIQVTYKLEHDSDCSYEKLDDVHFFYRNLEDMKRDRDMFNELLEQAGY